MRTGARLPNNLRHALARTRSTSIARGGSAIFQADGGDSGSRAVLMLGSRDVVGDDELLERWRSGDELAGQQLFERYFESLYRFFFNKIGDDIDDLVQQTLLACVEGRDRFRQQSSFRTYLFAVARNKLYTHYERRPKDDEAELSVSALLSTVASPAEMLVDREEQRWLLRALRRLPLDFQITLELFYWENLSQAELAQVLVLPIGTVKSRLRKGRQLLEQQLAQLIADPELLASTTDDVDAWVHAMRECVAEERRRTRVRGAGHSTQD
jgi:RNA polymerase sigma factor (sigma-70 family)